MRHHLEHDLHPPHRGHRIVPAGQPPPHLESVLAHDALMYGQRRTIEVVDPSIVQHCRHTDGLLLVPVPLDRVLGDLILLGLRPPHGLEQLRLSLLDHRTELQAKLILLLLGPTVAQLAEPPLLGPFATSIRSSSTFGLHRLQEVHHLLDLLLLLLLLLLLHGPEEFGALGEQLGHGLHMSHRSNWRAYAAQTEQIRNPAPLPCKMNMHGFSLSQTFRQHTFITTENGMCKSVGPTVTSACTLACVPVKSCQLLACHRHGDWAVPYMARASSYFTSPNSTQRRGGRLSTLRSECDSVSHFWLQNSYFVYFARYSFSPSFSFLFSSDESPGHTIPIACALRALTSSSPSGFRDAPRGEHLSTRGRLLRGSHFPRAHPLPATHFQCPRSRTATLG